MDRWRWCSSTRIRTPGPTTASASTMARSSRRAVREGIIDPDRSIQIGIRTHAPDSFGIKILYGHEVEEMRASDIAYAITERTGGKKTYVTFDIDCLDPAFAPGTGTPVAGGPSLGKDPVGAAAAHQDRHCRRRRGRGCAGLRSCRYHGDRRLDGRHALSRPAGRAEGAA